MALNRRSAAALRWMGHETWNIGIVEQSASDIVHRGIISGVRWLPQGPRWTFVADPFALPLPDGEWELFAERMDYWKAKGTIWGCRIGPSQGPPWAALRPELETVSHMSFPFAFSEAGVAYLLCETWEAGGASLFARREGRWRFETSINPLGRNPIDPALFRQGDLWWLFCSHLDREPQSELYLYYAEALGDGWREHPANPVVRDASRARMAGPIFQSGFGLVRPGQDCSITYGGGLCFNRINFLSSDRYEEETIRRLPPIAPYRHGLHTICPAGDRTIIDGKMWKVDPLDLVRKIYSWRVKKGRRRALQRAPEKRENIQQ